MHAYQKPIVTVSMHSAQQVILAVHRHVGLGVLFLVMYAFESILNVTCVLTQQYKMALQGSLLASHTCTMLNTQQSYNAQDSGSIIRHKGAIRGSRVQMCDVYKGITHGYLTILSAVWAALLPVLER